MHYSEYKPTQRPLCLNYDRCSRARALDGTGKCSDDSLHTCGHVASRSRSNVHVESQCPGLASRPWRLVALHWQPRFALAWHVARRLSTVSCTILTRAAHTRCPESCAHAPTVHGAPTQRKVSRTQRPSRPRRVASHSRWVCSVSHARLSHGG